MLQLRLQRHFRSRDQPGVGQALGRDGSTGAGAATRAKHYKTWQSSKSKAQGEKVVLWVLLQAISVSLRLSPVTVQA